LKFITKLLSAQRHYFNCHHSFKHNYINPFVAKVQISVSVCAPHVKAQTVVTQDSNVSHTHIEEIIMATDSAILLLYFKRPV